MFYFAFNYKIFYLSIIVNRFSWAYATFYFRELWCCLRILCKRFYQKKLMQHSNYSVYCARQLKNAHVSGKNIAYKLVQESPLRTTRGVFGRAFEARTSSLDAINTWLDCCPRFALCLARVLKHLRGRSRGNARIDSFFRDRPWRCEKRERRPRGIWGWDGRTTRIQAFILR